MEFHAYVFFSGTCRAAFTRYQEVFGGELNLLTNGDLPEADRMPDTPEDLVMHAALKVGDGLLMGSDDPTGDGGPKLGVMVHAGLASVDEARKAFDALAEGGEVQMPMEATFWTPAFGMVVDRFGLPWQISVMEGVTA
jgi:PhnB protein